MAVKKVSDDSLRQAHTQLYHIHEVFANLFYPTKLS